MSAREYMKAQADTLPEQIIDKVIEFISFQKFSSDLPCSDQDYLESIPAMNEIIKEGLATPLSECISLSDVRKGVRC
ncbi:MAG: hypothetical protein FWB91_06575 [Defluviitaleaceae bacterium]|nr:hypothetical protein [Defluviitaleaceae bacterium]